MLLREKLEKGENLSYTQKTALQYILDHAQEIKNMTIKEIAKEAFTSPAMLVRMAKNLGCDGFEEFKEEFLEGEDYLNGHFSDLDPNFPFGERDNYYTIASKITNLARETAADTMSLIDYKSLGQAVNILLRAECIYLSAISFPLIYGYDFQLKLRRLGKRVEIVDMLGEQLYSAPIIGPKDCALIISYSGETQPTRDMISVYKAKNIPIVAITSIGSNTVRDNATVTLSMTTREKLYSKIASYSSLFSIKLLLDILYSCMFRENYQANLTNLISISRQAEPGRFSTSEILREVQEKK